MSLDYEAIREWDIVVSQVMFKFKTPFTNFGVRLIPQDCVESRGRLRCRCLNQFASMSLDYKAIREWDIAVSQTMDNYLPADYGVLVQYPYFW